jgi:hypothetical protein
MENLIIEFLKFNIFLIFLTGGVYLFVKILKAGAK